MAADGRDAVMAACRVVYCRSEREARLGGPETTRRKAPLVPGDNLTRVVQAVPTSERGEARAPESRAPTHSGDVP